MKSSKRIVKIVLDNGRSLFYAVLIAFAFKSFLFQPFWIPSGSMKDGLLIGDFIFVNKMAYGYSRYSCPLSLCPIPDRILAKQPKQGDVVVFRHPTQGEDYIKRIIGMPGDTIQITAGQVSINGRALPLKPSGEFSEVFAPQGKFQNIPRCTNAPIPLAAECVKSRFIETLPKGQKHSILSIQSNAAGDNTPMYTVPKGHYFVLGDNRDNSQDSRYAQINGGVGFVPFKNLLGRAEIIVFSSAGRSLLYFWQWRKGRFFKIIN